MKTIGTIGLALLLSAVFAGSAWADRPRHTHRDHARDSVRFSVQIGSPWMFPSYPRHAYPGHYWPHVYPPPVTRIIVAPPPVVYVEREPTSSVPTLEPGYWYYCDAAGAYYPQVRTCAGDWRKVPPGSIR
jgi:hypothetical protein